MKKFWMFAVVMCAALMIACGGDEKPSVEAKAKSYVEQLNAAAEARDKAKFKSLFDEVDKYGKSLSKDEKKKFDEIFINLASQDTKDAVRYLKSQR